MNDQQQDLGSQKEDQKKETNVQVVVFELDHEEYAVPILEVREVIKLTQITPVPQSQQFIVGVINLRGKIVPVIDLEKKFNLTRQETHTPAHIIITQSANDFLFGILVDKVEEVLKVTEDSIKPAPSLVKSKLASDYIKGVIVLTAEKIGSERVLLMMDLQKILMEGEITQVKEVVSQQPTVQQAVI